MNGYLMKEEKWMPGQETHFESFAMETRYGVVFEDDGEAAYLYGVAKDKEGTDLIILDALHIFEMEEGEQLMQQPRMVQILWSRDWLKCALIIDGYCHALYDFETHGGYNINEFPPPNNFWTKGGRQLSDDLIKSFF